MGSLINSYMHNTCGTPPSSEIVLGWLPQKSVHRLYPNHNSFPSKVTTILIFIVLATKRAFLDTLLLPIKTFLCLLGAPSISFFSLQLSCWKKQTINL